jgi:hypothetical protein
MSYSKRGYVSLIFLKNQKLPVKNKLCSLRLFGLSFGYLARGEWRDNCLFSILREEWKEPKILTTKT